MSIGQQSHGRVAVTVPVAPGRLGQRLDLVEGEVLVGPELGVFRESEATVVGRPNEVRIPMIVTTCSDGSRPPVPIDRDRRDGAVRYIC